MGIKAITAIVAIFQIFLSFIPLGIYFFFSNSIDSLFINIITSLVSIFSFVLMFVLMVLIFQDKETTAHQKTVGLVVVLILSGFGALLYLLFSNKNKSTFETKINTPSGFSSKGLFRSSSLGFYLPKVEEIINSPSFSKVSDADKKTILFMERNALREKPKERITNFTSESDIAYYKNGKPVYKRDIKSHSKV